MTTIFTTDEKKTESKLSLFQRRRDIRSNNRSLELESWHYLFLKNFIKRQKKQLLFLLTVLLIQVFIEVGLFIYSKYVDGYLASSLNKSLASKLLIVLIIGVIVYLVCAFIYLWIEKTLLVQLINELRVRWFSVGLYRQPSKTTSFEKARLVAKLTYHFSLVQAGFSSAFSGTLRWIINNIILLLFCFFIDTSALTRVLISIPVAVILGLIGYLIGRNYLSREASLSTAIITHITQSLDKVGLLQNQHREQESLQEMDKMVYLDSQLKVRRNLWMEFGFRILFTFGVLGAGLVAYIVMFVPQINIEQLILNQTIVSGLVLVYITRQLYLGLRVGLFLVPLKIGLALSLPGPENLYIKKNILSIKKDIEFSSDKVKLSVDNNYLHNLKLVFSLGKSYLIYGKERVGKTTLSYILSGKATSDGNPWIIRVDGKRYRYKNWCLTYNKNYYLPVLSLGSATIVEIIAGCNGIDLNEKIINKVSELTSVPALSFIKQLPKFISTRADNKKISHTERQLIELASCLFIKPQMVVIDNLITDNKDPRIVEMIQLICSQLKDSVIICFSTEKNSYTKYEKIFKIQADAVIEG